MRGFQLARARAADKRPAMKILSSFGYRRLQEPEPLREETMLPYISWPAHAEDHRDGRQWGSKGGGGRIERLVFGCKGRVGVAEGT